MPEPPLRSPLAGEAATPVEREGLSLRTGAARGWLCLRATSSAVPDLEQATGLELAVPVTRFSAAEAALCLRLGPDEWLLGCSPEGARELSDRLSGAAGGQHVAIVDLGHRFCELWLEGSAAVDLLRAGCPLDFDEKVMEPGFAGRSVLGKTEIILYRLERDRFHILVNRSFAPYLWDFLRTQAAYI